MSDPKIIVETDESSRPVVEISGIPEKSEDVKPVSNFKFRNEDDSSSDDSDVESLKETPRKPQQQQKIANEFDYSLYADPRHTSKKPQSSDEESEEEYSETGSEESSSESEPEQQTKMPWDNDNFSQPESLARDQQKTDTKGMSKTQIRIKKKELLLKLHDAEQNGYQITAKVSMNTPLEDLEEEYQLYERRMEQNAMVDFLQDGLMFIIKGIEVFNGFYKPMGVNLTGLSDKIYDRREQLEHVLKRLAIKYSGGTSMPPELSLLFIIGGAMVMTHMSNTALKSGGIESLLGNLMGGGGNSKENPLMGMMSNLMKPQPKAANEPSYQGNKSQPQQTMKPPPKFDMSNLLSKMNEIPQQATKPVDTRSELPFSNLNLPSPQPFPKMTRDGDIGKPATTAQMPDNSDRFSVSSDISSGSEASVETMNITVPSRRKSRKKTKNVFQI